MTNLYYVSQIEVCINSIQVKKFIGKSIQLYKGLFHGEASYSALLLSNNFSLLQNRLEKR